MISVTELRAGKTFKEDGQLYIVLKYEHTKMGRGTANIRVKVRNLKTGAVVEKTYISGARVEDISTIKKKYQYLYRSGEGYCFMDPKDFGQIVIKPEAIGEQASFLREGAIVEIMFSEDIPLSVELPPKMEFAVLETGPGVKGDSATNIFKPAVLENGLKIKIPLFVNQKDKILVDTRTGEYLERVK